MNKEELKNLNENDTYSLILFTLCQLFDTPEYSVISELPYVLDRENLLRLCDYFGGMTIRIPTTMEMEKLLYALALYHRVNIDGENYLKVCNEIRNKNPHIVGLEAEYRAICEVLSQYNFDLNKFHVRSSKEDQ